MSEKVETGTLTVDSTDWLDEYQGAGQEVLSASVRSTPFLGLVQPDSNSVSENNPEGTWRNSANGKSYGTMIDVVVLGFNVVWAERENEAPYRTLARYKPHSIEVETRIPKNGRGFAKMYSKESGNEVVEQYIYAVVLPQFPEDGVLYFSPSLTSMKACRSWNSMMFSQLLPNGKQAPIFGFTWNLEAGLVPNPQQPNKKIAKLLTVKRDIIIARDIFAQQVKPQLDIVKQNIALLDSDGVEATE